MLGISLLQSVESSLGTPTDCIRLAYWLSFYLGQWMPACTSAYSSKLSVEMDLSEGLGHHSDTVSVLFNCTIQ